MSILPEEIKQELQKAFKKKLENPVTINYFTQELECPSCQQTHQLLNEVVSLSDKIILTTFRFDIDKKKRDTFQIDKIPAIIIMDKKDYGIRFYGLPGGYEFSTFIEDILMVSRAKTDLTAENTEKIKTLSNPLHIQVFITNTCPHCPAAAQAAHKLAFISDKIRADVIDAREFSTLSRKYNVFGVPKTIVNEKITFEGALPIEQFIEQLLSADKL